jgi:hypothetical protein
LTTDEKVRFALVRLKRITRCVVPDRLQQFSFPIRWHKVKLVGQKLIIADFCDILNPVQTGPFPVCRPDYPLRLRSWVCLNWQHVVWQLEALMLAIA